MTKEKQNHSQKETKSDKGLFDKQLIKLQSDSSPSDKEKQIEDKIETKEAYLNFINVNESFDFNGKNFFDFETIEKVYDKAQKNKEKEIIFKLTAQKRNYNKALENQRKELQEKVMKEIKDLIDNVDEAGHENPCDQSYYNALLNVVLELNKLFEEQ